MRVVKLARVLLVLLLVVAAAVYLPHFFWKAFDVNIVAPRVSYSPVAKKFLLVRFDMKETRRLDLEGKTYTRDEYEELLPLTYYRQLLSSGKMPESLQGAWLDASTIRLNDIYMWLSPMSFAIPQIQLFPLFESQSGRVGLEMPKEFFRIRERMEFIDCAANEVNENLSARFTDSLLLHGFAFPAQSIWGNPTTLKPFDEGYFVVDSENQVFHIKMVRGSPFCRNTGIPKTLGIKHILVQEMSLKEFYGLVVTNDNALYLVSYDSYALIRLPVKNYDPSSVEMRFQGDLFYRTISLTSPHGVNTVVTDREYQAVDTYSESWKSKYERTPGIVAQFLFPFIIDINDDGMTYVRFDVRFSGVTCVFGMVAFAVGTAVFLRYKKKSFGAHWLEVAIVLLTGVYGFIAVHAMGSGE